MGMKGEREGGEERKDIHCRLDHGYQIFENCLLQWNPPNVDTLGTW